MYNIEQVFPVDIYASDRCKLANDFHAGVSTAYKAMYENFWAIGREEVKMEQMQLILDRMGAAGIAILTNASKYVQGVGSLFPDFVEEKYQSAPYEYSTDTGKIVLLSLKPAWQPPAEPENSESEETDPQP